MDKLAFLLSEGVKNLWRHKLTSFSSIFSIFLTLIISGSLIIVSQNTSKVIEYLRDKYKIEVFFKNEITFEKVEEVVSNINKINGVRSTTVISKDDAEKIFKSQFGEDIMKIIGYNPLPISCVVNIVKDDTKTINIASIINKLKSFQEIDEINYQGRIISRIEGYYQLFVRLMTSILIIVFFISIFTISNTIRLTIYAKEKLIESLQLIGATRSFVKAPFIIEGILIGFIGSALSSLLLIGLLEFSYDLIYTYLSFEIEYDIKLLILTLCSLSIIISFIGSSRATARFLK
jgi:cell division transport system permease protein